MTTSRIDLVIPIAPVPWGRHNRVRRSIYYPKSYTQFRENMNAWKLENKNKYPILEAPLCVEFLRFNMPMRKSWSKKKRALMFQSPHILKPDIDNLEKAIFDSLDGFLFEDDCKFWAKNRAEKIWATTGSIEISISGGVPE